MSRSTATKVGVIACPLCKKAGAAVKKSSRGQQRLFVSCSDCGPINNFGRGYQDYINANATFDDETPAPAPEVAPEPETVDAPETPVKPQRSGLAAFFFGE